jgi:hypothetical protein
MIIIITAVSTSCKHVVLRAFIYGDVTIQHPTKARETQRRFLIKSCVNDKKQDQDTLLYAIFPRLVQTAHAVFPVPPWQTVTLDYPVHQKTPAL